MAVRAQATLNRFGGYPLTSVLNGDYLTKSPYKTSWTPIHAWVLAHYLFFSDKRRPQLRAYLAALDRGTPQAAAAGVFGDLPTLAREVKAYHNARKPYDRVTFPVTEIQEPAVRELSRGQAAFVRGRLELGSRVELPSAPPADANPDAAARMTKARQHAIAARDHWLDGLRQDAARYGGEVDAQLLLAEAECRSDHPGECLAAADRALRLQPGSSAALAWKGMAQIQLAAARPDATRGAAVAAARATITASNRADLDAVLPLIAYARSFGDTGAMPPPLAADAMRKVVAAVPDAPASRLRLATILAARGDDGDARSVLAPVVSGPYESPERLPATALQQRLNATAAVTPQGF